MVTRELLAREAAARGRTLEALLDEEIPKRRVPLPESSVLSLYQSLGERARGATLDQMRPALRAWLERTTEPEIAKMNYVEELMKTATRAVVSLAPPRVRVERTPRDPVRGPDNAPVEIAVFGDLQSAEYVRFAQQFGRVRDTFGDRVRLMFKHLPQGGLASTAAAEAAACAAAQGRFWPYHDALVAQLSVPSASSVSSVALRSLASDAGLDRGAFDGCLDQGHTRPLIRQALDEAARYGIAAQPALLVNGRLAPAPPSFLPPFEFFTRIVEQELLQVSRARF
jgi:protein-disulfide isomerase